MDLLTRFTKNKVYCDRINESSYTQSKQSSKQTSPIFPTIIDLFFSCFDHHYSLIENKDKKLYVKQLLMSIATEIDENKSNKYDNFNYLKCMNSTLIQQGLQLMNTVSCLLYLSDYYGVTTHVYVESLKSLIVTSDKERKEFNVHFKDNKWSELTGKLPDYKQGEFKDIGEALVLDVKTKDIYKKYLNPIGKYKSPELIQIAKDMGLPLVKDGKKKVKKELYDDINLYQLNLHS
jgi:hypothetical protein